MQFGDALAEQLGRAQGALGHIVGNARKLELGQHDRRGVCVPGRVLGAVLARQRPLVQAPELVARVRPGVALVGDDLVQDRERARLAARRRVLERAEHHGGVGEPGRVEVQPELEIGVGARLGTAEDLEDDLVAEHDRGVGLLGAEQVRLERSVGLADDRPHRRGRPAHQRPVAPGRAAALRRLEQQLAEAPVVQPVDHEAEAVADRDLGDHRVGRVLGDPLGGLVLGERERHDVGLGLALQVADLDQHEHRQARAGRADRQHVDDVHPRDPARLAGEPALERQERGDGRLQARAQPRRPAARPGGRTAGSAAPRGGGRSARGAPAPPGAASRSRAGRA